MKYAVNEMLTETERLLIRRFTEDDAEVLFTVLSDPEVMRYLEPPFTPARTRAFLREAGLCDPPRIWAVLRKETGTLIGHLIWHPWDADFMELGWVLRRDCWNRGFAKELTGAMLARADKNVVLECDPAQTATRRIAEAFGFRPVEEGPALLVYKKKLL